MKLKSDSLQRLWWVSNHDKLKKDGVHKWIISEMKEVNHYRSSEH